MKEQHHDENVISRQEGIKSCSPQAEGSEGDEEELLLSPVSLS